VISPDVMWFVMLGALATAVALLILKQEGRIALSWGAVAVAEVVILAAVYFAYWIFHQMVASV